MLMGIFSSRPIHRPYTYLVQLFLNGPLIISEAPRPVVESYGRGTLMYPRVNSTKK